MSLSRWIVAALAVTLLAISPVLAEERQVRITLADGTTVTGVLLDFGEHTYRVRANDETLEVDEARVVRVEVLETPRGRSPQDVLGDVLERARDSGALEQVLGEHVFRGVQVDEDHHNDGAERRREFMVRQQTSLDGEVLVVVFDMFPQPGFDPQFLNLDSGTPYRFAFRVGIDGHLVSVRAVCSHSEVDFEPRGDKLVLRGVSKGRSGERAFPGGADLVPNHVMLFVATTLADQGLPEHVAYRTLGDDRPNPHELQILRTLPGLETVNGAQVRLHTLRLRRRGEQEPGVTTVQVDPTTRRLLRFEQLRSGTQIKLERVSLAEFESQREAWELSEPPDTADETLDRLAGLAEEPNDGGVLGEVLRAARESGRLGRLPRELAFVTRWEIPYSEFPLQTITLRIKVEVEDDGLTLKARQRVLGARAEERWRVRFDGLGVPQKLRLTSQSQDETDVSTAKVRGLRAEIEKVERYHPVGDWPGSEERRSQGRRWRQGETVLNALIWAAPLVELGDSDQGVGLLHAPAYTAGDSSQVRCLEVPPDADELELWFGAFVSVPTELAARPARVVLLGQWLDWDTEVEDPMDFSSSLGPSDYLRRMSTAIWTGVDDQVLGISQAPDVEYSLHQDAEAKELGRRRTGRVENWQFEWIAASVEELARIEADTAEAEGGAFMLRRRLTEFARYALTSQVRDAQAVFLEGDKDQDGQPDYGSLQELAAAGLLKEPLAHGQNEGYRFEVRAQGTHWLGVAWPLDPADGPVYLGDERGQAFQLEELEAFPTDLEIPAEATPCAE